MAGRIYSSVLGLLIGVVLAVGAVVLYQSTIQEQPLIRVVGALTSTERMAVEEAIREVGEDSLWLTDRVIVGAVVALSWADDAIIHRGLDGVREVHVSRVPIIASMEGARFIGQDGESLDADDELSFDVPELIVDADVVKDTLSVLAKVQEEIDPLQLKIESLEDSDRTGWTMTFEDGFELVLGRVDIDERLERFKVVYVAELRARHHEVARVDARYEHGVAVAWRATSDTQVAMQR